jgi:DNA invertase Pin-like site-specific DNA recombinase
VVAWYVDQGVCSVTPIDERPALLAALATIRAHRAGVLVVAKRDRIARDVVVAAMVERAAQASGAGVVSASGEGNGTTPADAFMRTVIDGAAAYERALIRARTVAALAAKRAKGELTGKAPFGMRVGDDGVRLVPEPREQAILARVGELAGEGMGSTAIARALAAEGIVGRAGKPLAQPQVWQLMQRAA